MISRHTLGFYINYAPSKTLSSLLL